MFAVLDTNHFTEFANATVLGKRLMARIKQRQADVFSCIVAAEELLRGWLAFVRSRTNGLNQLDPYARLLECIETLNRRHRKKSVRVMQTFLSARRSQGNETPKGRQECLPRMALG